MQSDKPNIVLITFDQMGANILEAARHNGIPATPSLDRLAKRGVSFSQCISPSPVCGPARASIMTGLFPSKHEVWTNDAPPNPHLPTCVERLTDAGYVTGSIGKMHFTPTLDPWGFTFQQRTEDIHRMKGREHQDAYLRWLESKHLVYNAFDESASEKCGDSHYRSGRSGMPAELHQDHWVADRSIDFVQANESSPFFLWTSFIGPHDPINPPEPFDTMYSPDDVSAPLPIVDRESQILKLQSQHLFGPDRGFVQPDENAMRKHNARYYGSISFLDQQVGRLLDSIDAAGLSDNTYIVFATDHGEMLWDYGLREKGPWPYEQSLRVPLLIAGPGVRAGDCCDQLTSLVDLAPTFLDWAIGEDFHRDQQGVSLAEVCRHEPKQPLREFAIAEFGHTIKIVRDHRYSYAYYPGRSVAELYDRQQDPQQKQNLSGMSEVADIENQRLKQIIEFMVQCQPFWYEAKDITSDFAEGTRRYRQRFAPRRDELRSDIDGLGPDQIDGMFS